jgi:hypothetical protein
MSWKKHFSGVAEVNACERRDHGLIATRNHIFQQLYENAQTHSPTHAHTHTHTRTHTRPLTRPHTHIREEAVKTERERKRRSRFLTSGLAV